MLTGIQIFVAGWIEAINDISDAEEKLMKVDGRGAWIRWGSALRSGSVAGSLACTVDARVRWYSQNDRRVFHLAANNDRRSTQFLI